MIKKIMRKGIAALLSAGMILGLFPNSPLVEAQGATVSTTYEPIDISGSLNGNAIWGATESSLDVLMDDSAFLYSAARFTDGGLPTNGEITMPETKVAYKLAIGDESSKAYDGNDCIRLTSSSKSRTMDLRTIGVYQNIYVLATAGGPGSGHYADFKVTLNYTSGQSVETKYRLYDWYDTTPVDGVEKYYKIRRINNGDTTIDYNSTSDGTPVLHSAAIQVDHARLLKSITFTMNGKDGNEFDTSGLYCCVFAVTGATPVGVPGRPTATAATDVNKSQDGPCFTANWGEKLKVQRDIGWMSQRIRILPKFCLNIITKMWGM